MDYTAKVLKALYDIARNQEKLYRQNKAIIEELKGIRLIQSEAHGIYLVNTRIEDEEDEE